MKYNIHTIPAHLPFADTLAGWLLEQGGAGPLGLSQMIVLLPSRRAVQALREAFLRATDGRPLLLPRMQPLDDWDEDAVMPASALAAGAPAPGFAFRRLFILARLVHRYRRQSVGEHERFDHALLLARDLAHLFDECERERVPLANLADLVPDGFAQHWQLTIDFLKVLSEHWPQIAREHGIISPHAAREAMFAQLQQHWKETPPQTPVIAAGTTGSIPATAELLKAIATLPKGAIVLPGLELDSDTDTLEHMGESHPQWGMHRLLEVLGYPREDVHTIGQGNRARAGLLAEVMRPAETSGAWQTLSLDADAALAGLRMIACAHAQEEATVVALLLREALETPGKTAALVTHDRALAARVAAVVQRFGVTIDDSAGQPLAQAPAAVFLRLMLDVAEDDSDPVALFALLKHPLCSAGMERIAALEAARMLELLALREVNAQARPDGLMAALQRQEGVPEDVLVLLGNCTRMLGPLRALFADRHAGYRLAELLDAHLTAAEALSDGALWNGPEGDALEAFATQLRDAGDDAGALQAKLYPAMFLTLLHTQTLRRPYGMHPRLKILSPTEARMQAFDRMILGGLNEGSWPPEPAQDPWFSRAMRAQLGLPMPERRLGLAAHDFSTLACAPEVFLTRAQKTDGAPATPSRWWVKLEVLLAKLGARYACDDRRWVDWARALDQPAQVMPATRPAPRPPLAARPRILSVTQIEVLQRDPYSIYAAHILRLKPLPPLGSEPGNAEFGIAAHAAMEQFIRACPAALPDNAYAILLECGRAAFAPLLTNAATHALWWPRFQRIAAWVIAREAERRPGIARVLPEATGTLALGSFTLTGRADRIEERSGGGLAIIDYKTGTPPTAKQVEEGLSSQLVLLALIFGSPDSAPLLEYWHLRGGHEAGTVQPVTPEHVAVYMETAKAGLTALIERYNDPQFPYFATPVASRAGRFNDYAHLARAKEWG
jgi:ATP-dependent helicase/nuclease subunit B